MSVQPTDFGYLLRRRLCGHEKKRRKDVPEEGEARLSGGAWPACRRNLPEARKRRRCLLSGKVRHSYTNCDARTARVRKRPFCFNSSELRDAQRDRGDEEFTLARFRPAQCTKKVGPPTPKRPGSEVINLYPGSGSEVGQKDRLPDILGNAHASYAEMALPGLPRKRNRNVMIGSDPRPSKSDPGGDAASDAITDPISWDHIKPAPCPLRAGATACWSRRLSRRISRFLTTGR